MRITAFESLATQGKDHAQLQDVVGGAQTPGGITVLAALDGHGADGAYFADHMYDRLVLEPTFDQANMPPTARAFAERVGDLALLAQERLQEDYNEAIRQRTMPKQGGTSLTLAIAGPESLDNTNEITEILLMQSGDTGAFYIPDKGNPEHLTPVHNVTNASEVARLKHKGVHVMGRADGGKGQYFKRDLSDNGLQVSRGFGDNQTGFVAPDVTVRAFRPQTPGTLLLLTDGVWSPGRLGKITDITRATLFPRYNLLRRRPEQRLGRLVKRLVRLQNGADDAGALAARVQVDYAPRHAV